MSSSAPDAAGWIEACNLERLVPGDVLRFEHAGQTYAIYRTQIGQLFASDGFCTHGRRAAGGRLSARDVHRVPEAQRPLRHPRRRRAPAAASRRPLRMYEVREKSGKVLLQILTAPPPA